METKDYNKKRQLHILFFVFTLVITSITITIDKLYFEGKIEKLAIQSAEEKIDEKFAVFDSFLDHSKRFLQSINNSTFFNNFLKESNNQNKTNLEQFFLSFSNAHPEFMQLRYLDKNGNEIIRIDRDKEDDITYLIGKDKLQNKSNRYYFADSKNKKLDRVWFSALDLNIERGKN